MKLTDVQRLELLEIKRSLDYDINENEDGPDEFYNAKYLLGLIKILLEPDKDEPKVEG